MQLRHKRLYTGLRFTRTYSNTTKVVRPASNIQSPKEVNHCSLTLLQKYHGTQWQQTCLKPRTLKYLLIVDYYSRFPVLHKLGSTMPRVLVQEIKAVFAELGSPKCYSLRWWTTVYISRIQRLHKTLAN